MNCSDLRSRISELLDKEASYADSQKYRLHLEECGGCSELYAGLESTRLTLAGAPLESLSADFMERLQERIRMDLAKGPTLWQRLTTPRLAGLSPMSLSGLVAATVSAFIIGVSLFQSEVAPLVPPPQSATGQMVPGGAPTQVDSPFSQPVATKAVVPDTLKQKGDSTRRDFSRQIKLVNQNRP